MIVFSDLHLREESESVVFDEVLPGIKQAALKDMSEVAFLGDWWTVRYVLPIRLFNRVRDTLRDWSDSGIRTMLLPGNHDQVDFQGRNALESLNDIHGVEVFTEPKETKAGLWLPYRKDHRELLKAIDASLMPVAWMHHGVVGAMMNDFHENTDGLTPDKFQKFQYVFSGHYHKRQTLGNITYVGSPWQTRADESGQPKGYGVWNGVAMRFVDTHWGKRYFDFTIGVGDELDLSGVTEKDEVRVRTLSGIDPSDVGEKLAAKGIPHIVVPEVEAIETRLDVAPGAKIRDYAEAYVEKMAGDLNQKGLMTVFDEIRGAL